MNEEDEAVRELRRLERRQTWIGVLAWAAFFGLLLWLGGCTR